MRIYSNSILYLYRCRKYKGNQYWINQAKHIHSTSALCKYN